MIYNILFFILGLIGLLAGAELFVRGASTLAEKIGVSSLVIGLTVVSFGTSAPELAISISSGFEGDSDIMVGNVVGSNICNVLFILGIAAIASPLYVDKQLVRQDIPLLIGISILLWILSLNGILGFGESALLTLLLIVYLIYTVYQGRNVSDTAGTGKSNTGPDEDSSFKQTRTFQLILIAGGLFLLIIGSEWLVDNAIEIARKVGVSSAIIGLTVIALGTSLPEAATSVIAALRGERDIAVGNIVGSNIFNILAILGISGLIIPGDIEVASGILAFDIPVMIAVAIACLPIFFTGYTIARWEGFLFLAYYLSYFFYLFLNIQEHSLLPLYNNVMLWFVLPLTIITLIVIAYRESVVSFK